MTNRARSRPDETSPPSGHRAGRVSLLGRTNVGKSTLLNRLIAQKLSIVSDVPQTTRHRLVGVLTMPSAQIAFVDTPGIHKPRHRMNRIMVNQALGSMRDVDVILFLIDALEGIGPGDRYLAALLSERAASTVCVLNKVDLVRKERLLPMIDLCSRDWGFGEIVPVSALRGDNVDRLLDVIVSRLPLSPPPYPPDTLTDKPERLLVAELVREKVLFLTRQEVPHETAVVIERWTERGDGLLEIHATVFCERDTQKAIVIGRQGALLKKVGTDARKDIEQLLGRKVVLRLWVKVRPGWRESPSVLRELGITED